MELIEKIVIKSLASDYLVSTYPKVFHMNAESDLNFRILAQAIDRKQKQDVAMTVCIVNKEMTMMSAVQRQALNNLFPTSLLDIENDAISEKVEEVGGVTMQPCATNKKVGQECKEIVEVTK